MDGSGSTGQPATPQVATHVILDPAHPGIAAKSFEHPAGWQAQSMLVWNTRNMNNLAHVFARAFDPAGLDAWEMFPTEDFFHSPGTGMGMGIGMGDLGLGQAALGLGNLVSGLFGGAPSPSPRQPPPMIGMPAPGPYQVAIGGVPYGATERPPTAPADALVHYLIPKHRGRMQGLRILGVRPAPQLAEMLNERDVASLRHDGATARIAYGLNGAAVEEEFLCAGYVLPDSGGQVNWGLKPVMSFRAAAGQLDGLLQRCGWIPQTRRDNPQWNALYQQVAQQLHSGQQMMAFQGRQDMFANEARESAQRGAYFDWHQSTQASVAAMQAQSFQNRVEGFGDAMMGRTAYNDPSSVTGQPAFDYGHHQYVWTDGQGNFHGSDDANFDPNIGSDRAWTVATQPKNR